jgi:tetratricopeptide (TPR) repeat protein
MTFRDLAERRVPQYLAIYIGVCWGLVQFMSFLEDRYPSVVHAVWTDATLLGAVLLLPSVVLFTYNHGRPGRDHWTILEKIGIPVNLALAASILFIAFGGRDLRAMTDTVSITDENGRTTERSVPRSEFRKRLALFNFDADPADTAVAWLREGAATALATDLSQDIFLDIRVPAQFAEQLKEAGFPDGNGIPPALKRKIAEELHLPWFVAGSVTRGGEGYTVRVAVYETATLKRVAERVSTGNDVLAVIDDLSTQVRKDLGLPEASGDVKDLPVADLLSSNPMAFREYIAGQVAGYRGDWKAAESHLTRAAQADPTFALAHYMTYVARVYMGNAQAALPALDLAMQNQYRLPERTQFGVKLEHYFMRQDMDNASKVVENMIELYPNDLQAHGARAQLQEMRGNKAGAVASLQRIIDLDPQQQDMLLKIGELQLGLGDAPAAEKTYTQYVAKFPNEVKGYLPLSQVQVQLGKHADARESAEHALIIDPMHVEAMVSLALVQLADGEFDASWKELQDALAAARTPEDRSRALDGIHQYQTARGQLTRAIETNRQLNEAIAQFAPPLVAMSRQMGSLGVYASAGRVAEATRILARVRSGMTPPLDKFWRMGQLTLAIETRDTLQLHEGIAGVDSVMKAFGVAALRAKIDRGDAVLHEVRGDWNGALALYQRQLTAEPANLAVHRDVSRMYRKLGRLGDARTAVDRHLHAWPSSAESNIEAARVRLAAGDSAGARPYLDRAARTLEPADPASAAARELKELLAAR